MAQHTVPANEVAIKALRCPEGKARMVYHVDGHGNDGLKLYVESSGTKTWYFRARVRGSDPKGMPLGRWPDVTIADARKRKSAVVVSISGGEDHWEKRAEERRRKPGITLNDAFAEWLDTTADKKRSRDQDELRYAMNIRGGHQFILGKWKGRTHKTGIGHLSRGQQDYRHSPSPPRVPKSARRLRLGPNDEVFRVRGVCSNGKLPVMIEEASLPAALFPGCRRS